jgi:deoxycytidylate deaminase
MTCAKTIVKCKIIATDGTVFTGENYCNNPQLICPRGVGEGYEKCSTICKQVGHAEVVALEKAGKKALGATAVLIGHDHFCRECQIALFDTGVKYLMRE